MDRRGKWGSATEWQCQAHTGGLIQGLCSYRLCFPCLFLSLLPLLPQTWAPLPSSQSYGGKGHIEQRLKNPALNLWGGSLAGSAALPMLLLPGMLSCLLEGGGLPLPHPQRASLYPAPLSGARCSVICSLKMSSESQHFGGVSVFPSVKWAKVPMEHGGNGSKVIH